ncbi:MAG: hypothetical protein GTO18_14375 [Anaerolineales bacterium]|nr:hypothetical protein [Anaerolineales bacterium]
MTHSEEKPQEAVILSRAELSYLMDMLDAHYMVGLDGLGDDPPYFYAGNRESIIQEGRTSLIQRGLVLPGENGSSDRAEGLLMKCVITSFFPDSTLLVVRNIPQLGEQVLIFFRRENYILLHTFPEEFTHRMEPFDHPNQVLDILLDWFPLHQYPKGETHLRMPVGRFEVMQGLAERGEEDAAVGALRDQPLSDDEKLALVRAIENRAISGSFAVLYIRGEEINDAFSMAVLADSRTAWVLGQPDDDPEGLWISVIRVGSDFAMVMRGLIRKWLEEAPG